MQIYRDIVFQETTHHIEPTNEPSFAIYIDEDEGENTKDVEQTVEPYAKVGKKSGWKHHPSHPMNNRVSPFNT